MRLTQAVRIGGQLALLTGFAVLNFANGNSLTYFYGYSSPNLTAWENVDSLGSQNVRFIPQVPMVSQATGSMDTFGSYTSNWGNSNAYSAFSNTSVNYTAPSAALSSGVGWSNLSMGPNYSALNGYGSVSMGNAVGSTTAVNYTNVNGIGSWGAWFSGPQTTPTITFDISGWQPVRDSALPPVTSNFTQPTVTPGIVPPSQFNDPFSTPEPATVGLMAAGLGGLLYFRRRLC